MPGEGIAQIVLMFAALAAGAAVFIETIVKATHEGPPPGENLGRLEGDSRNERRPDAQGMSLTHSEGVTNR